MVEASGAMLAVHDALRASRVSHQISVFSLMRGSSPAQHSCVGNYIVVKDWKQRGLSPAAEAVISEGFADGGTPAAPAWRRAVGSLVKRPETRKILVVVTDGQTNNDASAKQVLDTARSWGIETYGIGLQSSDIRRLFPENARVPVTNRDTDLTRVMLDMVNGILTKRGSRE
jgi:nitric oxide reductase activation protein